MSTTIQKSDTFNKLLWKHELYKFLRITIWIKRFVNTLTAKYEYSGKNRENFSLPIQMQLSQKPEKFFCNFIAFLEFTSNFKYFGTKMTLIV